MSGKPFIISAPSGTGKTSILKRVMAADKNCTFSVSHTTRAPRSGELDGDDYFFVSRKQFQHMIAKDEFIEYAAVHDNYYGTALAPLEMQLKSGMDSILDIDVQGAKIIRDKDRLPATYVFIAPPSMHELERRLRGRGTESEDSVRKRLENARIELTQANHYEYVIVNDDLDDAVLMLRSIILAERARDRRTLQGIRIGLELHQ